MRIIGNTCDVVKITEFPAGGVFVFEDEAYLRIDDTNVIGLPRAVHCLTGELSTFGNETMVQHKPNATLYVDGGN